MPHIFLIPFSTVLYFRYVSFIRAASATGIGRSLYCIPEPLLSQALINLRKVVIREEYVDILELRK